jgi:hypothetical protein
MAARSKNKKLDRDSVVKNYFTTATDGKTYRVSHYTLAMALAIGFRVRGVRGTQFWQWVDQQDEEELRQLESAIKQQLQSQQ